MRLDRFRGWGPWLAFASPACFVLAVVVAVIAIAQIPVGGTPAAPPAGFYVYVGVAFTLMGLFAVTLLAVAVDLEWIEHPLTHTGLTYAALAAAALGAVGIVVSLVSPLLRLGDVVNTVSTFAWFAGTGVYLVLINWVGHRAGVLRGALAGIGSAAGIVLLVSSLLALTPYAPVVGLTFFLFFVLYTVWSIWLGLTLRGSAPATAPVTATA